MEKSGRVTEFLSIFLIISAVLLGPGKANGQDADLMLTNYVDALNANMPPNLDAEAVSKLFAENGVQMHPFGEPPGGPHTDREAIRQFFAGFDESFADWTHAEVNRMTQGNLAVWEGIAQGTHKETGKPLNLPMVFFITFDDDGLVNEARIYMDVHLIALQLE